MEREIELIEVSLVGKGRNLLCIVLKAAKLVRYLEARVQNNTQAGT